MLSSYSCLLLIMKSTCSWTHHQVTYIVHFLIGSTGFLDNGDVVAKIQNKSWNGPKPLTLTPSEIDLTLFLCLLEQISAKQQQLVCEICRRGTTCEVLARWDCAAFGAAALQL